MHTLANAMQRKHVSIARLSRETGLSVATVKRLMKDNSKGNVYTWRLVANALGVSIDELVVLKEKKHQRNEPDYGSASK